MTVFEGFKWLNFLSAKLFSGAIKPADYNLCLQIINLDFFKLKVGLPEDYQVGQPYSRQGYELTFKITDDVKHLRNRVLINKVGDNFPQPADFGAFSSARYPHVFMDQGAQVMKERRIEIVTDEERNYRKSSALLQPVIKKPIANYVNGGLEVDPSEVERIYFTYLRLPVQPVYRYIRNANDEDIQDPNNPSTQLDWPVTVHNDIWVRICRYFGINLREQELVNYMKDRQAVGE
jgi:hypothetical protein